MANVRVKMKPGALRKIRYLPETAAMLEKHGERVMDGANADLDAGPDEQQGFRMSSRAGARRPFGRWRVSVVAVTPHAQRADRKHNILLKALGGVGTATATAASTSSRSTQASGRRGRWTAAELSSLFSGSVADVAQRTGRSESAVRAMRYNVGRKAR